MLGIVFELNAEKLVQSKEEKNDVSFSSDDGCDIEMAMTSTPVSRDKSLYMPSYENSVSREEFNKVMMGVGADNEGLSPVKYQIRSPLETVSSHTKRQSKGSIIRQWMLFPNYCLRPFALVRI